MQSWTKPLQILALACGLGQSALAADRAGQFDYYVLALSWQPNWCLREGDDRDAATCKAGAGAGWTLHGLWPQYEKGWPQYCSTTARDPSRSQTGAMSDIMGSGGLAWHQWKKHGRCTGLTATDYFDLSREAYTSIQRPNVFRRLDEPVRLPASLVEEAFLQENPDLFANGLTVTCQNRQIAEVRICLDKDLAPRTCGKDIRRDCSQSDALFTPLR